MKKLFIALVMILSVFTLVACNKGKNDPEPTIDAPQNVLITESGLLIWDAVEEAEYYIVYIDQMTIEVRSGRSLDLTKQELSPGEKAVSVVAVKGDLKSVKSSSVKYTVSGTPVTGELIVDVLRIINPMYESVDLTKDDFIDDFEYENYARFVKLASTYSKATQDVNMTSKDALGFFGEFYAMTSGIQTPENLSELLEIFSIFNRHNVDGIKAATIIYHIFEIILEINVEIINDYEYEDAAMYEELLETIKENKTGTIESLSVVISFILKFKDALPLTLINDIDYLIENGVLSIEELILIKDEIADILLDEMPVENDFELLYTTLLTIIQGYADVELEVILNNARYLAEGTHLSITLVLEFVKSIDKDIIDEISNIIALINNANEQSPTLVVETLLNILIHLENFIDNNSELFDELNQLLEDQAIEEFYIFIIEMITPQIIRDEEYMSYMYYVLSQMLIAYKDNFDVLRGVVELIGNIGINLVTEFIDSEALLFYRYIDIISEINDAELSNSEIMQMIITEIFPLVMNYRSAIFSEFTEEQILNLVEFIKYPVLLTFVSYAELEELPNIDLVVDDFAEIISGLIKLQTEIFNAIADANIPSILDVENLNGDLISPLMVVYVLNQALTSENEELVFELVDIVFENIFKDPTIFEFVGSSIEDIDRTKDEIIEIFEYGISEIRAIASFDLSNLSKEELSRIENVKQLLEQMFGGVGYEDPQIIFEEKLFLGIQNINVKNIKGFYFHPEQIGFYSFESMVYDFSIDPYIEIYTTSMELIGNSDDVDEFYNFGLKVFLENNVYYIKIGTYNNEEHEFIINIVLDHLDIS